MAVYLMLLHRHTLLLSRLHVYPRTPDSSEGSIPRATICYMGIDPYVMFFEHQD